MHCPWVMFVTSNSFDRVLKTHWRVSARETSQLPKKDKLTLLPSDNSKADKQQLYNESVNKRTVTLTSFKSIWNQQCSYLKIMKLSTDLSQKHSYLITNSANILEEQEIERIQLYENHVKIVKVERDYFRQQCGESASTFHVM